MESPGITPFSFAADADCSGRYSGITRFEYDANGQVVKRQINRDERDADADKKSRDKAKEYVAATFANNKEMTEEKRIAWENQLAELKEFYFLRSIVCKKIGDFLERVPNLVEDWLAATATVEAVDGLDKIKEGDGSSAPDAADRNREILEKKMERRANEMLLATITSHPELKNLLTLRANDLASLSKPTERALRLGSMIFQNLITRFKMTDEIDLAPALALALATQIWDISSAKKDLLQFKRPDRDKRFSM